MIAAKEQHENYLATFSKVEKDLPGKNLAWLGKIRKEAMARFAQLGFPTTHNEEWKYTSVAPIASGAFQPAGSDIKPAVSERLRSVPFWDLGCPRLVFINGHYSPTLSQLGAGSAGVKVSNLRAALTATGAETAALEQHLTRYAAFDQHAFVALNTALFEDGAFIEIGNDRVLEKPIYLLYVSTANGRPTVAHPRTLLLAGRGSEATFIEGYASAEGADSFGTSGAGRPGDKEGLTTGGAHFTNAVTEIVAGEGAVLDYCKTQAESESALHVSTIQASLARSSSLHTHSVAFGSGLAREEVNAVLDGEGAECLLDGLFVSAGKQHVDNHTTIDHAKPHCGSRELYKGVLDGRSTGVFNGKIIVRKDAQKTDSKQSNKNLLLSEDAVVNTKPQLEIYADDVKCTHGATIGQVDQEAIFYLRSRGIGHAEARRLLIQAFASEIIDRIKFEPLRARLRQALLLRLANGARKEA